MTKPKRPARKYDVSSVMAAIRDCGASPAAIAERLGCTRGTVYSYLNRYPELKAAFEEARGTEIADRVQFTKEQFIQAIDGCFGVKAAVADRLGCSRQTVDNALRRWPDLVPLLEEEDNAILDLAQSALVGLINQRNVRAVIFALETRGRDRGWSRRTEITGADGAALLPADLLEQVRRMGMDPDEVVKQFVAMIEAAAAEHGV